MKAGNLFVSFVAVLVMCWGNVLYAGNASQAEPDLLEVTVNINQANAETLASVLNGVGIRRAEAIVAYREKNGKFYSAEELSAVRGIGLRTVEKNESRIVLK
ncbi:MAG: helix-hairpin-helix domain-containing protein [Proteobacteria bacterium]|nr:helix-hairpin-helix domain-containing protein [Pseudomonadota bacterium]